MLTFVYDREQEIGELISRLTRRGRAQFGRCKTIGIIDEDGKLIAGLVYHNYDDEAGVIEFGMAVIDRRAFTRTAYRRFFEYPFIECECQMLITRVRSDNEVFLSQLARMNFNLTLIPRMFGRDEDGVLATLTDDQWLDSKLSKKIYRDLDRKEAA